MKVSELYEINNELFSLLHSVLENEEM